jgi:hypothetical protein
MGIDLLIENRIAIVSDPIRRMDGETPLHRLGSLFSFWIGQQGKETVGGRLESSSEAKVH